MWPRLCQTRGARAQTVPMSRFAWRGGYKKSAAICNLRSKIYTLKSLTGVLAQLVERLNGIEEVTGSNPVGSTPFYLSTKGWFRRFYDGFMTHFCE